MANNRLAREVETRDLSERPKQWMPPELLPEPDKEPGYAYRWVCASILGEPNARNLSSKFREGWEPIRLEEQPKFQLLIDPNSRFKDLIEVGGLLLCKCPLELVEQRNAYYAKQSQEQIDAVDNNLMRQSDPRAPLFKERKSEVRFGSNQ